MSSTPIPDDIYERLNLAEGGSSKVTKDTGGTTKGGVAAKGSGMTPAEIRRLTPEDIRKHWRDKVWAHSGAKFKDPRVGEIALHYAGNAGYPTFGKHLQGVLNKMNPNLPPLKVDGVLGKNTVNRIHTVDQTALGDALIDRYQQLHNNLTTKNPKKYGAYAKGWANRRTEMRNQFHSAKPPALKVVPGRVIPNALPPTPMLPAPKTAPQPTQVKKSARHTSNARRILGLL